MGQLAYGGLGRGPAVSPPPGARVLKAADYAALLEAEALLAKARKEAAAIVAAAEAEAKRRVGVGYAHGLKKGKDEAAAYLLGIVEKGRGYLLENEARVVALVLAVLKRILGDMDERELVVRMVRAALSVVSRQSQVRIVVAPDKVETVKGSLEQILRPYPGIATVEVAGDPGLAGERCVLETRAGRVESSLEAQLRTLMKAMTDAAPGRKDRLEQELKAFEAALAGAGADAGAGATAPAGRPA